MQLKLPATPPPLWPKFHGRLRSPAVTARVGRVLGICFTICFVTGVLSHYQYHPWSWLPEPASPVWGYRLTQGLHVITGIATIPLLLVKLWSVYPKLFEWPPVRSLVHALERISIAVLVSSAIVELFTGFFNAIDWYPWPWNFVPVHRFLAYIAFGSLAVHVAVKLPIIQAALATKVDDAPTLTSEGPGADHPGAEAEAITAATQTEPHRPLPSSPETEDEPAGLSRRGLLVATAGGVGLVVATTVGQTVTPLAPISLFAPRQSKKGPSRVPVNRTADQAAVTKLLDRIRTQNSLWQLHVKGPKPYTLSLAEVMTMSVHEQHFPISCVEGWSVGAQWRGIPLLDIVKRAGGDSDSRVRLHSLEPKGSYNFSYVDGPQVSHALLATHINGDPLINDHGYPLRLIAPNRAGVLNTKWLSTVEVL